MTGANLALPLGPRPSHGTPEGSSIDTGTTWRYSADHVKFVQMSSYQHSTGATGKWTQYNDNTGQPRLSETAQTGKRRHLFSSRQRRTGGYYLLEAPMLVKVLSHSPAQILQVGKYLKLNPALRAWSVKGSLKKPRINVNAVLLP